MRNILYQIGNYFLNKRWILCIVMRFLSEGKKEKIHMARFRAELAFWGHDVSNMTNEEIREGVNNVAKVMCSFGATIEEAATAVRALGTCK